MAASVTKKLTAKALNRRYERNILTFYEKIAVIRYAEDANISRNRLARMFHCCATQIRRILERKDELLQHLATLSETDAYTIIEEMTRKRRKFEMSAVGFILHQWVERCRQLRLRTPITDQTLKDTAMKMAAILNLPAFRPSYRWMRHFRNKYKYSGDNLGPAPNMNAVAGEVSVEDIIIEYKDALPNFMQKEISAITSSAKCLGADDCAPTNTESLLAQDSSDDYSLTDDGGEGPDDRESARDGKAPKEAEPRRVEETGMAMGTAANELLSGVFPHMAVIHQFALWNADAKALELISQLGVHMQMQASAGAYRKFQPTGNHTDPDCAAFDDIELIE